MDIWTKTEQVRLDRVDRERRLDDFMRSKKDNQLKQERESQVKGFEEGLTEFEENCLKLGIDIEHDPERPNHSTTKEFNKITFLERIADKAAKEEHARKDKVKRLNNLSIMQKDAAVKSEKLYDQQSLVDHYAKLSNIQSKVSEAAHQQERREEM